MADNQTGRAAEGKPSGRGTLQKGGHSFSASRRLGFNKSPRNVDKMDKQAKEKVCSLSDLYFKASLLWPDSFEAALKISKRYPFCLESIYSWIESDCLNERRRRKKKRTDKRHRSLKVTAYCCISRSYQSPGHPNYP